MSVQKHKTSKPWRVLIAQKFAGLGGAQKSLFHHLELLDRGRFEPHVLVAKRGWLTEKLAELQVPWSLLPFGHWTNLASLPRNMLLVAQLKSCIRRHHIDLVHANEHWVAPACYWAARRTGLPVICHFRTGLEDLTPRRVRRYLYGRFDRVIVVAEVLRLALAKEISDPSKIVVIRDGVEPFRGAPHYWRERRTRIIINVGAILEMKGQAKVLEHALPWLKENRHHFLLFVGGSRKESDYAQNIKRTVANHGLQKQALFLGSREDVPRLLRAADALVAYSTLEGVPRVVMEAMFAGRPVIVSNTPGMGEVVTDGEVGRIVNLDDTTNRLLQFLRDMTSNPSRWETMGRQGRERALSRYSIQAMADQIQALYTELLARKNHCECHR